jgi:hypothetical protein
VPMAACRNVLTTVLDMVRHPLFFEDGRVKAQLAL